MTSPSHHQSSPHADLFRPRHNHEETSDMAGEPTVGLLHEQDASRGILESNTSSDNSSASTTEKELLPHQRRSLSGIAMRALLMGIVLGVGGATVPWLLLVRGSPAWRLPLFLAQLALFHFLEFFVTARYNTRRAAVSSYLFSQNGVAYNVAHCSAVVEFVAREITAARDGTSIGIGGGGGLHTLPRLPTTPFRLLTCTPDVQLASTLLGLALVVAGQIVRSLAMRAAGTNFNHTVQRRKASSHRLVTHGVYAYSRHPSYAGFFWWALGTQLLLGNVVCSAGFAAALWMFFRRRIEDEERLLRNFFGREYAVYQGRVRVGIPGIR